VKHFDTL